MAGGVEARFVALMNALFQLREFGNAYSTLQSFRAGRVQDR